MMATRQYYTWHMPSAPDISSERTVAVEVNYGKRVYVAPAERNFLYATYVVFGLGMASVIGGYLVAQSRVRK